MLFIYENRDNRWGNKWYKFHIFCVHRRRIFVLKKDVKQIINLVHEVIVAASAEAVAKRCSVKKVFLKILLNLQKNICVIHAKVWFQ